MSTMDNPGTSQERGVKTLAIRLEPDLHAQLSLIAQLRGSTITDEIRTALATHIESIKAQPEFAARADDVLDAIAREALARREAIASLFGVTADRQTTATATETPGSRGRKPRQAASSTDEG